MRTIIYLLTHTPNVMLLRESIITNGQWRDFRRAAAADDVSLRRRVGDVLTALRAQHNDGENAEDEEVLTSAAAVEIGAVMREPATCISTAAWLRCMTCVVCKRNAGWWCRGCSGAANVPEGLWAVGFTKQQASVLYRRQFGSCCAPMVPCYACNREGAIMTSAGGLDVDPEFWDGFDLDARDDAENDLREDAVSQVTRP